MFAFENRFTRQLGIAHRKFSKMKKNQLGDNRAAFWRDNWRGTKSSESNCFSKTHKLQSLPRVIVVKDPVCSVLDCYGFWNECRFSCWTSRPNSSKNVSLRDIHRCVKENGCLQVLKGSHKMGRIGHALTGEQAGADLNRVEMAKTLFELVHVELDPGDVLFFHCNLLHTRYLWRQFTRGKPQKKSIFVLPLTTKK